MNQSIIGGIDVMNLGKTTRSIYCASQTLGIRAHVFNSKTQLLSYGGKDILFASAIPNTGGAAAHRFCKNKQLANQLLSYWKYPTLPTEIYMNAESAISFLNKHKNITIKPLSGLQGNGVSVGITSEDELDEAFLYARDNDLDKEVLLQKTTVGDDYRILVLGKKHIFGLQRICLDLVGDGVNTISELLEIKNKERINLGIINKPVVFNAHTLQVLNKQGYLPKSILEEGQIIQLSRVSNMSQGGITKDVTAKVSQKIRNISISLATKMNMDVIGIDIMISDISDEDAQFFILEINNEPDLSIHNTPTIGQPQDVATALLEGLFPV